MAMTKESVEFNIYADVWNLHKKYFDITLDDDTMWEEYVHEADAVCKKYDNNKLARNLVAAVTDNLEERATGKAKETKIA